MQSANLAFVISQAQDRRQKGALGLAVASSIEVGVVVPSILRRNLEDAGFGLVTDTAALSEYGFKSAKTLQRTVIRDGAGVIVAMGAAGNQDEALLAAILGWFRENALPDSEVPAGFGVVPQPE